MPIDEILAALESVETKGSFCTDKSIPLKNIDIKCNKIGLLQFPLPESQIKALIAMAAPAKFGWRDQTILDQTVRHVWEVSKNKIQIGKKQWRAAFGPALDVFKTALGLPKKSTLTAELHNLLIYEPGHFFKPHQDSEKIEGMVATLVVILPTLHEGGELIITHQGCKKTFKYSHSTLDKLSCIAFYADCYHEVKEVTSGYRVSLTYNLILEKYQGDIELLFNTDVESKLEKAFKNHFFSNAHQASSYQQSKPPKVVYLLDHQYTQHSLCWDGLKNTDQDRVNALLKIAEKLQLTAHLALADMQETWDCEYDEYAYRKRRGYYDDDDDNDEEEGTPVALMDTSTVLRHWLNDKGEPTGYSDFTPNDDDVCWTGANEALEPYQSEYEPWTGNYGNTLDKWYHRAAIILWRKDDYYPILFEMDEERFIKEIFLLAKSTKKLPALHEMLQYTAPYWERYSRAHQEEGDISAVMELALHINDEAISQNLLKTYRLSIINPKNMELWVKLITNYGYQWFIELLTLITAAEKRHHHAAIKEFSALIQILLNNTISREIIDWLLQYQFNALKAKHKAGRAIESSFKIQATNNTADMMDFIQATRYAMDTTTHLQALHYLMENEKLYPALSLVELFETSARHIPISDLEDYGYHALFYYLMESITREHQLGLRDKEDWRIPVKSSCSCSDCKLLDQFLNQRDAQQKIWPLIESARSHITQEVKKLGIPIDCIVEHTGRPYKLILTKTKELYSQAEKRYKAIEQAMKKLNLFSRQYKITVPIQEV